MTARSIKDDLTLFSYAVNFMNNEHGGFIEATKTNTFLSLR
jgi:hypothetical protein